MPPFAEQPIDQEYGYAIRSVRRPFSEKFPTSIGIILGILQMLLNGAIVGLEGGSVAYNPKIDIVYAGFWCSFSFFLTWISIIAFLCFRKTLRWGLVVAGVNFASIAFAVILIVFDSLFIQRPCRCYLATVCDLDFEDVKNCTNSAGKSRVIKAQLACTATMLATNIGYIIIFIIIVALSRASYKPLRPSFQRVPSPHNASPLVSTNLPMRVSIHQPPRQSPYDTRYRQTIYPEEIGYWRPSTPYFNRVEKF